MFRFRLYGLNVASNRRIEGLAASKRDCKPDLHILFAARRGRTPPDAGLEPLAVPDDGNVQYLRVLRRGDGAFIFRFDNGARFEVSAGGARIAASWPASITFADVTSYLLGPVLGYVVRLRGTICLHASAVLVDGAAVAFLGPSGAGKSSMCAYFAQRGAAVLTDDVLALRRGRGGFYVLAGPARVRLWPDSVRHLYGARAVLPRVLPSERNWDKRYRDFAPGVASARLVAIYARGAGDAPKPRVSAATGRDAFLRLAASRYPVRLPVPGRGDEEFEVLASLAESVPLRSVRARRRFDGMGALHDAVREDLRQIVGRSARAAAEHARVSR